ncbi:DeoR/GlpR transcriptional regulator, partial [Citrobacter freundii]
MLQAERYKMICSYVQQNGSALVAELSAMCSVS